MGVFHSLNTYAHMGHPPHRLRCMRLLESCADVIGPCGGYSAYGEGVLDVRGAMGMGGV